MPTVLTKAPADPDVDRLRAVLDGHRVVEVEALTRAACERAGVDPAEVGAVLGASSTDDLSLFPALEWVHSGAAGVDAWVAADAVPAGARLTSAVGNGAVPLAEHALMLMLQLSRSAPRWAQAQREHRWDRFVHGELAGSTLGLVGLGHSGTDLAGKALACHMSVLALTGRPRDTEVPGVTLLHGQDGLRQLLAGSDHVVVTCPLTARTRGLIGAEELSWMRPTAFVVVVSRGGVVDEDALVAALRAGTIAGAGLDAHPVEPLPADSPLWDLPNVVVTPHNAATTPQTAERGRQILLDNARRWAAGLPLRNVVDLDRGY
ncbi:D-2-hydroxyacid dehydrogenase [Auraticoccus sp. F435]|uniref:D-2-hydroxyacid dehydrogenase n=1 Tax=Auraticoccus cholistanensis TaxID=2656650 RepID=A0A6A9URX1_9ACTN|nr:D-2-hydroxyacid dehydrogenase [Auraticoccus cholistanensis]MVA74465.1 D-2-hydroxyacid dehydrogenase [Auraticoccus cholistanensis]